MHLRLFLVGALVSGCGDGGARATVEVRDSAGIRIVTSSGPAWSDGERWRVASEPSVSIGVLEGDPAYQLFDAIDATRLSDGSIVVANTGTNELRFYDQSGRHVRTVGGEGEGPGEFETLRRVGSIAGDTIIVWDWSARRVSRFAHDGSFIDATKALVESLFPQAVGLFADGSVVLDDGFRRPTEHGDAASGPVQDSVAYVRIEPVTGVPDTLGTFPGDQRYVVIDGDTYMIFPRPFGDRTALTASGDRYWAGRGDAFEIRVFEHPSTRLVAIWRRPEERKPVTDEAASDWLERRVANASEEDRPEVRARYRNVEPAEYFPVYTALLADDAGYVWAKRPDEAVDDTLSSQFDVFAPDGRYLGALKLPRRLDPVEIGVDWVLATMQDEFEVGYVVLHALDRTPTNDQ